MKQIFNFWLKPGQTIDLMEKEETGKTEVQINIILFFICLYGTLQNPKITTEVITKNLFPVRYLLIIMIALFGIIIIKYVLSSFFWVFSKLFQGKSTMGQIRLVMTYSLSPLLVLVPFVLIQYIKTQLFPDSTMDGTLSGLFKMVFSIVTFSYLVYGLCKVNKFSCGYGILTIFLADFIIEILKLIIHR